ncbi:O-methyltransferase family 3 protein [Desarmillaria tabescens]|uniref:O-methyltransferase family 3 protein n=1 Tax=Armillaria tabescens TaxID=1929756 RepID=A0AA39TX70_ARMTA|nr:O-methyltransferase family 3 protein [Desarmillaria tabescens]KAK0469048.1 O-methyltransferase family 3 protein [Desarmillaria tabescens]
MANFSATTYTDWTRSDKYHRSFLTPTDDILRAAVQNSDAHGLRTEISVSTALGRFLNLLARSIGAKRILEIGTLAGYSTIYLARALPKDGKVISLELHELHAKVASENIALAGLSSQVDIVVGPALQNLANFPTEQKFDLIFIDADKPPMAEYFAEAKRLVKQGGVIILDNVVLNGDVARECLPDTLSDYDKEKVMGIKRLLASIQGDNEVEATTISTADEKGYDGFMYVIRK